VASTNDGQRDDDLRACVAVVEQLAGHPVVGASREAIRAAAGRMGLVLPDAVAEWLGSVDGEHDVPIRLYGLRDDLPDFLRISTVYEAEAALVAASLFPLADDGFGNQYVYVEAMGCVGFVEALDGLAEVTYLVGSSIARTVANLERQAAGPGCDGWDEALEVWPFDRDAVAALDPDLLLVDSPKVPW
jgi:hypothetical protein